MNELRAPDPTLVKYPVDEYGDPGLLPVTGLGDSRTPVAHRPRHALRIPHPCRDVGWSPTPALLPSQAAYIAVPCRDCFPDASPPGHRQDRSRMTGRDGVRPDPGLAWQTR